VHLLSYEIMDNPGPLWSRPILQALEIRTAHMLIVSGVDKMAEIRMNLRGKKKTREIIEKYLKFYLTYSIMYTIIKLRRTRICTYRRRYPCQH